MDGQIEALVTPSGRGAVSKPDDVSAVETGLRKVLRAFDASSTAGLFSLAITKSDDSLTATLAYWQDLARQHLNSLCQTPEADTRDVDPVEPPGQAQLASLLLSVPPMEGAEYLSLEVLQSIWRDLDTWVREQVCASADGLSGFLQERAPQWHQVGHVCFHLAENKRDESYPFAFLATYIPVLSGQDRVRYRPLSCNESHSRRST